MAIQRTEAIAPTAPLILVRPSRPSGSFNAAAQALNSDMSICHAHVAVASQVGRHVAGAVHQSFIRDKSDGPLVHRAKGTVLEPAFP